MKSKQLLPMLAIMILVFSAGIAQAPKAGAIGGYVKDARNKAPLIEAVITITSDVFEGSKLALTDSTGLYSVKNLPAGTYSVTFEMEGYRKYKQENIVLKEGNSLGVSLQMAREQKQKVRKVDERIVIEN
ncbi:carboxypeptidase-like regulatory domain-containing protein [Aridibaculum aurantiacum]|uniref:carboxypeptidase-like regulatory domain-containing protein n=1 Tax=Aridibaculum aurantiacum TaxID=2810307 RepID=UPI001A960CBB|nr:carboxypeptidase-like regulatory domain-containing protein [Aridibaculum aurantiacum]